MFRSVFFFNLKTLTITGSRKNTFTGLKTPQNCLFSSHLFFRQSWTKVLGHFCISGAFSNSHRSNPSPHPTNNVGRVYPELCENINSWRIRSRLRRVMRQQASIPSSAKVDAQRHQVKSLWSKPPLKLGSTPPWRRNNQWEGASAMFSFDGTYFKSRRTLKRWQTSTNS